MSAKTFVDTNVLIYAHDVDAGMKHEVARRILRDLWGLRAGILSTQVLQEFYINVTRKIATPLPKPSARTVVDSYSAWCIVTTPEEIAVAFRIEDEAGIGFWDALIVAAARKAGADRILSEDLNPGQIIAGVRIEKPLLVAVAAVNTISDGRTAEVRILPVRAAHKIAAQRLPTVAQIRPITCRNQPDSFIPAVLQDHYVSAHLRKMLPG